MALEARIGISSRRFVAFSARSWVSFPRREYPARPASPVEGQPADAACDVRAVAPGQRQREADAAVPGRRARPVRPAARRDRTDRRRRRAGRPVAREGPAAAGGGGRHARRPPRRGTAPRSSPFRASWRRWSGRPTRPCCSPASRRRGRVPLARLGPWPCPACPGRDRPGRLHPRITGTAVPMRWSCPSRGRRRIPAGSTTSSRLSAVRPRAARDADALLATQQAARTAVWERLSRRGPEEGDGGAQAHHALGRRPPAAARRPDPNSLRSVWVARTWVLRAGELTGHGDDLFFLELPEVFGLLRGERAPLDQVPGRRAVYEADPALPSVPALIRGRFDPARLGGRPSPAGRLLQRSR